MQAKPRLSARLLLGLCMVVALPVHASLTPQGPTAIVTQVYRNPLDLPVLGTRAYLPIAWVAHVRGNPQGIAPGREGAASDTFDSVTNINTTSVTLGQGALAPGAVDAFRLETRGYFFTDEVWFELETADGWVTLDNDDPNVLSNLLTQSFWKGLGTERQPTYSAQLYPQRLLYRDGVVGPGPYELTLEDVQIYFGLPFERFTLDDFLTNLPAPDFAQALVTLPAYGSTTFEVPSGARQSGMSYSLATIGSVRARQVETGEIIEFGSIAYAQQPRGIPEPATWTLLAGGAARRTQRTKWRACPTDSGVTSTTPSGLT